MLSLHHRVLQKRNQNHIETGQEIPLPASQFEYTSSYLVRHWDYGNSINAVPLNVE
jgi:hypothetical protein